MLDAIEETNTAALGDMQCRLAVLRASLERECHGQMPRCPDVGE
jgi:hypothetical protein